MYNTSNKTNISEDDIKSAIDIYKDASRPTIMMLLLFSVVGVIGNALVLIVYCKITKKSVTQMLIFLIAIFDFLTALIVAPGQVLAKVFKFEYLDVPVCKFIYSISMLFVLPGLYLLAVVSFIRYLLICKRHLLPKFEPKAKVFCGVSVGFGVFLRSTLGFLSEIVHGLKRGNYSVSVADLMTLTRITYGPRLCFPHLPCLTWLVCLG